jgi:hypothetical protein
MCFAVFSSVFRIQTTKKSQHTLATNRRSGWLQTLLFISPSEERLASSGLASRHIASLLNGGGDLLQAHKYHIAKGGQNSFYFKAKIRKLRIT